MFLSLYIIAYRVQELQTIAEELGQYGREGSPENIALRKATPDVHGNAQSLSLISSARIQSEPHKNL